MDPLYLGLLSFVVLILLLAIGIPVGIALLVTALPGIFYLMGMEPTFDLFVAKSFSWATGYEFTAMPLFLLVGYIAMYSNLTGPAFDSARIWLDRFPGNLAMATSLGSGLLGACIGSGIPATAAMAKIAIPEMLRHDYDKGLAAGSVAASGAVAVLIPPSIVMVVYAVFTEVSLGKMLLAGYLPGLLSVLAYMIMIGIRVHLNPKLAPQVPSEEITWGLRLRALKGIWGIALLFFILLGGIYSGWFTASEAAGMAAFAAFILMFITRNYHWAAVKDAFSESLQIAAMTFLMLIGAAMFVVFMILTGLPKHIAGMIVAANLPPMGFVIMVCAMYFVLGCFLPSMSMLLVTLPIVLPVLKELHVDLIWFGIISIKMIEVGGMTPPFGIGVYVVKGVVGDEIELTTIFKGIAWFAVMDLLTMAILMAFPQISLWLPSALK